MQTISPRVQNKTRSFELTRARRSSAIEDAGPELSLKNGYDKAITACAVSVNGLMGQIDFVYSEDENQRGINPGAIYTKPFSHVHRSVNHGVAAPEEFDINVLAVVFDDKTSDGDEKAIASILYDRLRSKRLLTRVVDLLNGDLDSPRSDDAKSSDLRSRISSLSSDLGESSDINDVLRWLDQLDQDLSFRTRIIRVKETCERLVARL